MPNLDQALSGARLDCAGDLDKQLIKFGRAGKVWMTIQVVYEPVNPMAKKQPFEQYLSAAPTRMFNAIKQSPHLETPLSAPFEF